MKPLLKTVWETPDGRKFDTEDEAIEWWVEKGRSEAWAKFLREHWGDRACNWRVEDLNGYHEDIYKFLKGIYE